MRMRMRHLGALALFLCCTCEAGAQTNSADRVLQSFSRCRTATDAAARLDCFERATTALESEVNARKVTILDQADVRKARKSLFGFTVPRIALFGGNDAPDAKNEEPAEFTELNTVVVSARPGSNGRVELRLAEESAVWTTTDPMPFPPKPGAKIRIRKGALGNYFLSVDGARSVRGMRLR
jgi:hypothetical protein